MPNNLKLFLPNCVYFVTTRIASGLPLIPAPFMQEILLGILARAVAFYPVTISDLIVMGNHLHLIAVTNNSTSLNLFMRFLKTESAHAINRLLGKVKGSVWEEGYDSPIILDLEALQDRLLYIYTNPQRANLVDTIDQYPNISSWNSFTSKTPTSLLGFIINRPLIKRIPRFMSKQQQLSEKKRLLREAKESLPFSFDHKAAFSALADSDLTFKQFQQGIIAAVREEEAALRKNRVKERKHILGASALLEQSIAKLHTPKKFGNRMLCLAVDGVLRRSYIETFRDWVVSYHEDYLTWRKTKPGPFSPPGFFFPGLRPVAVLTEAAFWE